jgi:hypothetical protein
MHRLATPDDIARLRERILDVFPSGQDYMTAGVVRQRLENKFAVRYFTYDEVLGELCRMTKDRILERGTDFPKSNCWKRP